MKTAARGIDLPPAPDAFAFPESAVKHIVAREITFGPITLLIAAIVTALDEKTADIINAGAGHLPVAETEI